jgi:hypothetical protein
MYNFMDLNFIFAPPSLALAGPLLDHRALDEIYSELYLLNAHRREETIKQENRSSVVFESTLTLT